jgi:hypothetical protein
MPELWFDPETGRRGKKGRCWQVIHDGDAVSLLADNGNGKHVLIGSATWTGRGLAKRYAVDEPIEPSTWGKLEHVLRQDAGDPEPEPEPSPAPANVAELRFVVSTSTGDVIAKGPTATPQGQFEWLVNVDGGEVVITDSAGAPVATATWTGIELADRPETIEDRVWKLVEQAMREAIAAPATQVESDDDPQADETFRIVVDLSTRKLSTHKRAGHHAARTAFEWNVIVDSGSVRIEDSTGTLLGTAVWTGKRLKRRKTEHTINDFQWDVVEDVLIEQVTGKAAPARPERESVASNAPPHLIVVDLTTGKVWRHGALASTPRARTAFEWNVIADGSRTTATIEDSNGKVIATAKWDGQCLTGSGAPGEINEHQWGIVENAWTEVLTWDAPGERAKVSLRQASRELVGSRDKRSGWWAFGAFLLALVGFIVAILVHTKGDNISLATIFVLGVLAAGLGIYAAYGAGTRCPSCKAWYRRKTTSVDNLGSHTEQRQVSKPVYDSAGKQTGTTYETKTVTVTRYRYNYKCKECGHTWTGTGTSES